MNYTDLISKWTDEQFAAWLAGYFDGEGCVYLPKNGVGVELSIASTDGDVIAAVHKRLGVGIVTRVEFSEENWKTKYHWRVRNYPQCDKILRMMRPFLTIKAGKADEALAKTTEKLAVVSERVERNRRVLEMLESGMSQREVGELLGMTQQNISYLLRHGIRGVDRPRRDVDMTRTRDAVQTHKKVKRKVTTDAERILWSSHKEANPRQSRRPTPSRG